MRRFNRLELSIKNTHTHTHTGMCIHTSTGRAGFCRSGSHEHIPCAFVTTQVFPMITETLTAVLGIDKLNSIVS